MAKKGSKSQANYSSNKGELTAIIHFLIAWKYYLQYRPFLLRTDHQSLTWIHTQDAPTGMIARWLEVLASFNFKVLHREGASHGNADALSRIEHAEAADPEGEDSESVLGIHPPEYPPSLDSLGQEMHALGNRILGAAATKKLQLPAKSEILMAQQNDNVLMQAQGWVRTLKPPDRLVRLSLSPETQL
jgi:hypothetical protein